MFSPFFQYIDLQEELGSGIVTTDLTSTIDSQKLDHPFETVYLTLLWQKILYKASEKNSSNDVARLSFVVSVGGSIVYLHFGLSTSKSLCFQLWLL